MILKEHAERLLRDETFLAMLEDVRDNQIKCFATSKKDEMEKREEAHAMLRLLDKFESSLHKAVNDGKMKERKN